MSGSGSDGSSEPCQRVLVGGGDGSVGLYEDQHKVGATCNWLHYGVTLVFGKFIETIHLYASVACRSENHTCVWGRYFNLCSNGRRGTTRWDQNGVENVAI